ncbi:MULTISPECIES: hypothetical protein [Ramlibacter]|uniref:STAS domain-containing protein n=1 Tax=Ramlibacter aquaticus TaxID=2780094 RepID=A0ABR9SG13_9BURK|nr:MULTISPECIES: hypothetical protein [Ramlibacter]MBE7941286.1 hypothetical protein [Ramlibacter aquaticus]
MINLPASCFRLAAHRDDSLRTLMASVDAVAGVTSPEGRRRVLVDLRGLARAMPHTEAVILCHHIASVMVGSRVALLADEVVREGESVAKMLGGRLRWFSDPSAAITWLDSARLRNASLRAANAALAPILEAVTRPMTRRPSPETATAAATREAFSDSTL